mgnify:CR=1 FL=1
MKILLGISGSIAAYKSPELVRLLKEKNFEVRVVMTKGACEFITPLCLSSLTKNQTYTELFSVEEPMLHIDLARWADLIVIAPASASILARLAQGEAGDLLSAIYLASSQPVLIAPAMNQQMWKHPAVKKNLAQLEEYGVKILPTDFGSQACGEIGYGRMLEPEKILACIENELRPKLFQNYSVIITAGATQEAIDPIRYLSNHSSGKMGYALAKVLQQAGASVTLISGKTALKPPPVSHFISVNSAQEMYDAVMQQINQAQIFIAAAAVADYQVKRMAKQKIKKKFDSLTVELIPTPDILKAVGNLSPKPFMVGFAAETENLIENAEKKLLNKNCDLLIANLIKDQYPFDSEDNTVWILSKDQKSFAFPKMSKYLLAEEISLLIAKSLKLGVNF